MGLDQSYLVPTMDIIGEQFLLNQHDQHVIDSEVYGSSFSSFKENLSGMRMYDSDPFSTNQFMHPYQGSLYHGFTRSADIDFWPSVGFTAAGSLLWELGGESRPPSISDQITTRFGRSFLGEPLFRMASLLLESCDGRPGSWREVGAAAISPATGFNRYAYGKRFHGVFRSYNPAVYTRVQLGVNLNATVNSNVNVNPKTGESPIPHSYQMGEAIADFSMTYGLPGKPGYIATHAFSTISNSRIQPPAPMSWRTSTAAAYSTEPTITQVTTTAGCRVFSAVTTISRRRSFVYPARRFRSAMSLNGGRHAQ